LRTFLHGFICSDYRKREIDGKSWLERASTVPSTRLDILGLQQRFETELNVTHAKSFGICPIRRRIYDELFGKLLFFFNFLLVFRRTNPTSHD
jgi:hypothetical protein